MAQTLSLPRRHFCRRFGRRTPWSAAGPLAGHRPTSVGPSANFADATTPLRAPLRVHSSAFAANNLARAPGCSAPGAIERLAIGVGRGKSFGHECTRMHTNRGARLGCVSPDGRITNPLQDAMLPHKAVPSRAEGLRLRHLRCPNSRCRLESRHGTHECVRYPTQRGRSKGRSCGQMFKLLGSAHLDPA